jgi:hypothetical protein
MSDKLQLPSVTLICIDGLNANRAIKVLEHCKSLCDFGAVKLLTHIPCEYEHKVKIMPLNSLVAYSIFMLTKLHNYIDTPNVLIVQRDGWILNPQSFNPEWLNLDFIGPIFVQYDKVGSGGFSLRSRYLMQEIAKTVPEWDGTQKHADEIQDTLGYYEDGVICLSERKNQFKIASLEQAAMWAQGGNRNPVYYREYPFGYHGTWQNINHETGKVYPVCEHEKLDCTCNADHVRVLYENEQP